MNPFVINWSPSRNSVVATKMKVAKVFDYALPVIFKRWGNEFFLSHITKKGAYLIYIKVSSKVLFIKWNRFIQLFSAYFFPENKYFVIYSFTQNILS